MLVPSRGPWCRQGPACRAGVAAWSGRGEARLLGLGNDGEEPLEGVERTTAHQPSRDSGDRRMPGCALCCTAILEVLSPRTAKHRVLSPFPGVSSELVGDRKSTRLNSSHPSIS